MHFYRQMATPESNNRMLTGLPQVLVVVALLAGCSGHGDDGNTGDDEVAEGDGQLETCGGPAATACAAGFYCDYPDDTCGAAGDTGVCQPLPQGCDDVYEPVCACDGAEYENACTAAVMGFDATTADCTTAEPFACGDTECNGGAEYCSALVPGVPGGSTSYSCTELPAGCEGCDCLTGPACDCMADDEGNPTLTCYAP